MWIVKVSGAGWLGLSCIKAIKRVCWCCHSRTSLCCKLIGVKLRVQSDYMEGGGWWNWHGRKVFVVNGKDWEIVNILMMINVHDWVISSALATTNIVCHVLIKITVSAHFHAWSFSTFLMYMYLLLTVNVMLTLKKTTISNNLIFCVAVHIGNAHLLKHVNKSLSLHCADIVKVGDKRPYYQLEVMHDEHLIAAVAGNCYCLLQKKNNKAWLTPPLANVKEFSQRLLLVLPFKCFNSVGWLDNTKGIMRPVKKILLWQCPKVLLLGDPTWRLAGDLSHSFYSWHKRENI